MKRGVIDTLRRGLDSTVANWPLLLLRFAEAFLMMVIAVAAAVAVLVPIAVSIGLSSDLLQSPAGIENAVEMLVSRWVLILYVLAVITVIAVVFVAIHSFVEAGCARVYVEADRAAGPATNGPRSRFNVFSIQRWAAGATEGWWPVFWIYNLAWGLAALILLVPLVPMALLVLLFQDAPAALIATGCLGAAVFVFLLIAVTLVVGIWTNRAIVAWAVTRQNAQVVLSSAWASVKSDFGRLFLVSLALFVISMAGSSFFASFSFLAGFVETVGKSGVFHVATLPVRLGASILSTAFSAVMSGWFVAAFAAIAVEERR